MAKRLIEHIYLQSEGVMTNSAENEISLQRRADKPTHYAICNADESIHNITESAVAAFSQLTCPGMVVRAFEDDAMSELLIERLAEKEDLRELHIHGVGGGTTKTAQYLITPEFEHDLREEGVPFEERWRGSREARLSQPPHS